MKTRNTQRTFDNESIRHIFFSGPGNEITSHMHLRAIIAEPSCPQRSMTEAVVCASAYSDFPAETPTVSLSLPFFPCLLLRGLTGLHYILQKNIWEESEVARSLHVLCTYVSRGFTKTWLSCLRCPTFRHAIDHFVIRGSPDIAASFLWSLLILLSSVLPFFISDARSCHRYFEPNDCSAPILLFI